MAEKPTEYPDWAVELATSPISGQNNYETPPGIKAQFGWEFDEKPPRQWQNWWQRVVGLWIRFLDKSVMAKAFVSEAYDAPRAQLMIFADTTAGAFPVKLPENPEQGDEIQVFDVANTFISNPVTLDRNGSNINGVDENLLVDEPQVKLVFVSSAIGWRTYV